MNLAPKVVIQVIQCLMMITKSIEQNWLITRIQLDNPLGGLYVIQKAIVQDAKLSTFISYLIM